MTKVIRLGVVLLLVVAACGGDEAGADDAPPTAPPATTTAPAADAAGTTEAPTTTAATTTTSAQAVAAGDDFCEFILEFGELATISPLGMSPNQLEETFEGTLATIETGVELAPAELTNDVIAFREAYSGFVEFLAEYEYNFMQIPEDALNDPRLAAMEDPALQDAGDRIEEYCGLEGLIADAPDDPGDASAPVGTPGASLPEGFPAELVPPDGQVIGSVSAGGGVSVNFVVTGNVDDVVDYYQQLLGPPLGRTESPTTVLWAGPYGDGQVSVTVVEASPGEVGVNVSVG